MDLIVFIFMYTTRSVLFARLIISCKRYKCPCSPLSQFTRSCDSILFYNEPNQSLSVRYDLFSLNFKMHFMIKIFENNHRYGVRFDAIVCRKTRRNNMCYAPVFQINPVAQSNFGKNTKFKMDNYVTYYINHIEILSTVKPKSVADSCFR